MAGLVGYASSDDEGEDERPQSEKKEVQKVAAQAAAQDEAEKKDEHQPAPLKESAPTQQQHDSKHEEPPALIGPTPQSAAPIGPSLPPADTSIITTTYEEEDPTEAPQSPYSANRALIHHLTLPSVPNLDIPPSPPGSPPPDANKKFEQFLQLKKKGTHFNSKLEKSTTLRNPALMDKLLAFVEIDEAGQYETTLPTDLWDPKAFPDWAFRDRLKKTREKVSKEKEADKASGSRSAIDFVPSVTASGGSSVGTGGLASRGEKRKGGWR